MDPIIVAEVWADQAAAIRAMARRAHRAENLPTLPDDSSILGRLQRTERSLKTRDGSRFDFFAPLPLFIVLGGLEIAGFEHMEINEVNRGKCNRGIKQPDPPTREQVVQLADAVDLMFEQGAFVRMVGVIHVESLLLKMAFALRLPGGERPSV